MKSIRRKTIRLLMILALGLIISISGCTGKGNTERQDRNDEKKPPVEKENPAGQSVAKNQSEQTESKGNADTEEEIKNLAIDWLAKLGYDKESIGIGQINFRPAGSEPMWLLEITNETGSFCSMRISEDYKIIRLASFTGDQNQASFIPGDPKAGIVERLDKALGVTASGWKRFEWNPDKANAYFRKYVKSGNDEISIGEITIGLSEDKKSIHSIVNNEKKLNESFPIKVNRDTAIKNAETTPGGGPSKVLHAELVQRPIHTSSGELNAICWEIIYDNSTSALIRADNGESPY